jgi:hypothetical protein
MVLKICRDIFKIKSVRDAALIVLVVVLPMAPLGPLRKCLCIVVLSTSPSHHHFLSPSGGRYSGLDLSIYAIKIPIYLVRQSFKAFCVKENYEKIFDRQEPRALGWGGGGGSVPRGQRHGYVRSHTY